MFRYEMSMTLNMTIPPVMTGLSSRNDWIGTNDSLNLLTNYQTTRSWDPYPLQNVTFWASGNSQGCIVCSLLCHSISSNDDLSLLFSGMHIMTADSLTCRFKLSVTTGLDISIYLGFAIDQTSYCQLSDTGTYTLTTRTGNLSDPTISPSFLPTSEPSFLPTRDPSFLPTAEPSFIPTVYPSSHPSTAPTGITLNPTASPIDTTHEPTEEPILITFPTRSPGSPPTTAFPTWNPSTDPTQEPVASVGSNTTGSVYIYQSVSPLNITDDAICALDANS